MPSSCAPLSFRPQLECPDGSSGHKCQLQFFDILQSSIPFGETATSLNLTVDGSLARWQTTPPNFSFIQTGKVSKFTQISWHLRPAFYAKLILLFVCGAFLGVLSGHDMLLSTVTSTVRCLMFAMHNLRFFHGLMKRLSCNSILFTREPSCPLVWSRILKLSIQYAHFDIFFVRSDPSATKSRPLRSQESQVH